MPEHYLEYQLSKGFVHNWLVAGPHATPVPDLERFQGEDYKLQIAQHYHRRLSEILEPPLEKGTFQIADQALTWEYYCCLDDHFVDVSAFHHTCHYLRTWAYSQVRAPSAGEVTLVLTTNGPADLWINGQHAHRQEHFYHQDPHSVPFQATLREGWNEVLVRFEEVAARECPYEMALQIVDLAQDDVPVRVPTYIEITDIRLAYERLFELVHTEKDIALVREQITFHLHESVERRLQYAYQLQDWRNRIYLEGESVAEPGASVTFNPVASIEPSRYDVVLRPRAAVYYEQGVRYLRRFPLRLTNILYASSPYGTYETRRQEALRYAVLQGEGLYAEIAKFPLGRWANVDDDVVLDAIERINHRGDCSDFYLVGLLGLMYRHMDTSAFPSKLREPLKRCVLDFKYWHDEPGADAMCYTTENHAILFHTCEILAGQLFPDAIFSNADQPGSWHREKGERLALEWLHQRGTTGFSEWDSNCYFEEDLLALSHLFDLAQNEAVHELAAVVMDKLFFTMAANSFQGVFGSTHGRTYAPMIKGAQLEATSPISRLMWGMGVWNDHIRGSVALACSDYELPPIIPDIAADPADIWHKEHHPGVDKVTFRTRDYMLCSAQDYRPGEKGYQQHIWQATLGHDAVVFVTHPPCMSEEGSHRPNFWHGNYILPRVAQWGDVLFAIHNLPTDDWMGFTHAYWPVYAFDKQTVEDRWAFARLDNGYIALTAACPIELVTRGPSAYRELRSYGTQNVWLCHMGRAQTDGSFADFCQAVKALDVSLDGLSAACTTLRGETLSLAWEGPFLVNGQEQPLHGFKHYEGPFCVADLDAEQIDIHYGEYLLRLHFDVQDGPKGS
jgi:hypothetical protein